MLQTLHLALLETHPASALAVFGCVDAFADDKCLVINAIELLKKIHEPISISANILKPMAYLLFCLQAPVRWFIVDVIDRKHLYQPTSQQLDQTPSSCLT
jgi:hypothetical protein